MFGIYDNLPWQIQAFNPFVAIVSIVLYFHRLFHLNTMELFGVTFCVIVTFYWIHVLGTFVYRNWVGVWLGYSKDLTTFGKWAVVTGSTQGIGLAYAHALAKRGLNIVLLSRSREKLSATQKEISEQYNVHVKTISVDFTGGLEIYKDIKTQLDELEVGVLINNVGICYPYPELYIDLPGGLKFCSDLINCNILSVSLMTQLVLPGMIERKKGVVVNVGSLSSVLDSPFMSLYGASKAFVDKLTMDLDMEFREYGIIFQSVMPGYVVGSMSRIKNSSAWVPTADNFVEKALNAVGLQNRTAVWVPHQILHLILKIGHFFRRDGATTVTQILGKQFWLYGKKVMMYKENQSGLLQAEKSKK